jgi:hypothetical protein
MLELFHQYNTSSSANKIASKNIMKFTVTCIIALLASQADAFTVPQAAHGQRTFSQSSASALKFMPAKDVSTLESMTLDASSLAPVDIAKKNDSMALWERKTVSTLVGSAL